MPPPLPPEKPVSGKRVRVDYMQYLYVAMSTSQLNIKTGFSVTTELGDKNISLPPDIFQQKCPNGRQLDTNYYSADLLT